MVQVHGGVDLCQIVGIVLAELGGLVWNLARRPALVAVFQPQQVQRNTAALAVCLFQLVFISFSVSKAHAFFGHIPK